MNEQTKALIPLAERLRPQSFTEVLGQRHLLAEGKPLANALHQRYLHSMIFWGPPGVGKTTMARLLAQDFNCEFFPISAVLGGVKDIRSAVTVAEQNHRLHKQTIVFVDEVHRFSKAQQDAFLPHVEAGLFYLVGATTENPSFEVNSALLSRATVYVLYALSKEDLLPLIKRAEDYLQKTFDDEAKDLLIQFADGDARRLLNLIEAAHHSKPQLKVVGAQTLQAAIGTTLRQFDKGGEYFYDTISALHKAVRGSDPDATLYWYARMLDGGVDPRYICRRMIRMAVEDIGLSDPKSWRVALDAAETYERLGSPEGELAIAQALIYLAVTVKSNRGYLAFKMAKNFIENDGQSRPVPLKLRNAPTQLMKNLDYAKGYRYAHDEEDAFAAGENYWPDGLKPQQFYIPSLFGVEARIEERLAKLRDKNKRAST